MDLVTQLVEYRTFNPRVVSSSLTEIILRRASSFFIKNKGVYIMNKISKICYGLGFVSIALSAYVYGTSGVADATYVGLWVPSFFLVADFFDRHV